MNEERVLITGSEGYVGSRLIPFMLAKGRDVTGLDVCWFCDANVDQVNNDYTLIRKDLRDVEMEDLKGFDVVIHLAGLSNDPLSDFDPKLTYQINYEASKQFIDLCEAAGVKKFIYASSQSVYGIASGVNYVREKAEFLNPITAYAKSKAMVEDYLFSVDREMKSIAVRPSTVFGFSPRFRSDIVFNNFLLSAVLEKRVALKSDGTPWRPAIYIEDMCWLLNYFSAQGLGSEIWGHPVNLGANGDNYTVRQIADIAVMSVPKSALAFARNPSSDERSYRVCFDRLEGWIPDYKASRTSMEAEGATIASLIERSLTKTSVDDFKLKSTRLAYLQMLQNENLIDCDLRWR